MVNSIVLILVAVFIVILSGLFAGAETGMYQFSRLRLRLGVEKRRLSFVVLGKAMRDSTGLLFSMLIGNNLTHYIVTSIVTLLLLSNIEVEHTAELFATLITAPILFIFAELIPKNIFFYRADSLMPYFAPVLFAFHKLFTWCGIVPLLKFISRIFAQFTGAPVSAKAITSVMRPPYIRAILQETREEGILSPTQTDIIKRLAGISNIRIGSVMTPISKVQLVDANFDNAALLNKLKQSAFTRLPVYDRWPANIIGFINIYQALSSAQEFTDLRNFIEPIPKLPADTIVTEAINIMQRENQKIVLVTKTVHVGAEKPIGIVTMKDLVEELLGELTEW